jgi:luciferase-like monooxygenase
MQLESKGKIRPPPRLKGPAQSVSLEIQSWPGIIAATHWFLYDRTQVDGADFYVGEKELGHIHLDGELHLCFTVGLRRRLVEAGLAEALPWAADCVQAQISSRRDARSALWLFRLAYDRLTGTPIPDLRRRICEVVR